MKRSMLYLFSTILFFLFYSDATNAASYQYIQVTGNTPIFDIIDGKKVNTGTLIAGEGYTLVNEDSNHYYIKFGNHTAFLSKEKAKKVTKTTYTNKNNASFKNSNKTIITNRPVTVKVKPSDKVGYAVIGGNMRYPIVDKVGDQYRVDVGNRLGYIPANEKFVTLDSGIPVLMYHHIVEDQYMAGWTGNNMVIRSSSFKEQMGYLKKNAWKTISMSELEDYLMNRANLTGRTAVITFDDGIQSIYKIAVPILRENNQKATSFMIAGKIRGQAQPWNQVAPNLQYMGLLEMNETGDVLDFQHHTEYMHLRSTVSSSPYLIVSSYEDIYNDLMSGKKQIAKSQAVAGPESVRYLAYPFGQYDQKTVEASKKAGIHMAFTTVKGNVQLGMPLMELPRQGVSPRHTLKDFQKNLITK